jgi:hypothetical protein
MEMACGLAQELGAWRSICAAESEGYETRKGTVLFPRQGPARAVV